MIVSVTTEKLFSETLVTLGNMILSTAGDPRALVIVQIQLAPGPSAPEGGNVTVAMSGGAGAERLLSILQQHATMVTPEGKA